MPITAGLAVCIPLSNKINRSPFQKDQAPPSRWKRTAKSC